MFKAGVVTEPLYLPEAKRIIEFPSAAAYGTLLHVDGIPLVKSSSSKFTEAPPPVVVLENTSSL